MSVTPIPFDPNNRGLLLVFNYNQAHEIGAFLDKLVQHYDPAHIVVVDDGSTDGSLELIRARLLKVLQHEKNRGIGAAIRTGLRYAQAQGYHFVIINSANGKMRPEELPQVVFPILKREADYTTGSRFLKGVQSPGLTPFRRFMIPLFSLLAWPVLRQRFSDITCGYRAYRIDWIDRPELDIEQSWLDRYEMEYYLHYWACRLGLRIKEVPVTIVYSHLGKGRKTKIRPFSGWWSMMRPLLYLALGLRK